MTGALPASVRMHGTLGMLGVLGMALLVTECRATPPADTSPPAQGAEGATQDTASGADAATPRLIAACCAYDDASIMEMMRRHEATPPRQRPPELAILSYRLSSAITRRDRIVVEDAAAWERLWPELLGSHRPIPPVPAVDFAREAIVVVTMGRRATGGYTISIDSARVAGDTITLVVTSRSPGRTCGTTAALSSPMALARVTRPRVPIRFIERTVVTDCG